MNFPIDKQAHFWWGWAIAATVTPAGMVTAIFLAAALGAAKEFWDSKGHGTPDKLDWVATAVGGIAGALVAHAIAAVAA